MRAFPPRTTPRGGQSIAPEGACARPAAQLIRGSRRLPRRRCARHRSDPGAGGPDFDGLQTRNGVHFTLKKQLDTAPKVLPLEALWWVDAPNQHGILTVAFDHAVIADRGQWRWRAMIVQPDPVDADLVTRIVAKVRAGKDLPALDRLRYQRWTGGRCAQILHIGPYAVEAPRSCACARASTRPDTNHAVATTRST